jgi:serine/threonine protein kinase
MAAKYISNQKFNKCSFVRELESLAHLNHPCVLRLICWAFPEETQDAEIITEYAERGSLEDVVNESRKNPEKGFWNATRIGIAICDMVLGMRFVHLQGIMHWDLKPSNILICENGRALIGDFGSSHFERDDATLTGVSGTVYYAAPEMFIEDSELTGKVDVWGFGVTLYEIFAGRALFPPSLAPLEVVRKLQAQHRPSIPPKCGEYMSGLIRRCWSDNPRSRPTFDDILREFQAREFAILPDADSVQLQAAVDAVLQWELDAGAARSRS